MTFNEIKELIELFDESNLTKLSIEENEFKIKLDKTSTSVAQTPTIAPQPTPTIAPQPTPTVATTTPTPQVEQTTTSTIDDNADYIKSPMVGTFYQAPAPDAAPYVKVGDKVKAGQTVCIVEAMKIMNDITAEFDGEIIEVLVSDGQAVEFDTPLFKIKRV